jgi:hypothetical protein
MNDLMLHSGGQILNYEELKAVPTPPATATWTPIPHALLFHAVRAEITAAGLLISRESLAISHGKSGIYGDRFFGLVEIQDETRADYHLVVGLRNSHSREYPIGLCVGSHVLICENLAFASEVVLSRRHTHYAARDLPRLINQAVGRLGDLRDDQNRRIEAYRNTSITDPQFHDLAIRSIDAGVLAASKVPHLLVEYRQPRHEEFSPRTLWSAFNAFSELLKDYDIQALPRRTQALHGLCDMICGLS